MKAWAIAIALLLLLPGCKKKRPLMAQCDEARVVTLLTDGINKLRAGYDLVRIGNKLTWTVAAVSSPMPLLQRDERLDAAAKAHVDDQAAHSVLLVSADAHTGSDGSQPFDRMKRAGYPFDAIHRYWVGEVAGSLVVASYANDDDLVMMALDQWRRSEGHWNVIRGTYGDVSGRYRQFGVGVKCFQFAAANVVSFVADMAEVETALN